MLAILQHHGVDLNLAQNGSYPPFSYACIRDNVACAQLIASVVQVADLVETNPYALCAAATAGSKICV